MSDPGPAIGPGPAPVLAIAASSAAAQALATALQGAGAGNVQTGDCLALVQQVVDVAPQQVIVALDAGAVDELLSALAPWQGAPPCAISVVISPQQPLDRLPELVAAGVLACAPGPACDALGSLLLVSPALHERRAALQSELAAARAQLDDRKWLDRAKGLLMDARSLSEDEAFKLLRSTAMHANLRLPEVARSVVDAARWAEAVNRAGQLRMLSQRLVALAAQRLARVDGARTRQQQALQRAQDNVDFLSALLLPDGDAAAALAAVLRDWAALKATLGGRGHSGALLQADERAEALLLAAEALTGVLQALGTRATLKVINQCGRQRMRSQRLAKEALLSVVLGADAARTGRMHALMTEFEQALLDIEAAPLSSPEIRGALAAARDGWLLMLRALRGSDSTALASASEQLLQHLDHLTDSCEHSLQLLLS